MKAIVKLLVTAVVLNAAARSGWVAFNYYQFKDAAQEAVTFGGQEQPAQIQGHILKKAAELELPVGPEAVVVSRDGLRTRAEAAYTQVVELFPNYKYPVDLSFSVDAVSLTGLK
jgi:hypothetical protein